MRKRHMRRQLRAHALAGHEQRLMVALLKGIIDAKVGLDWRRVKHITLATAHPSLEATTVPAVLFGRFGIHRQAAAWGVTDSVTGYQVAICESFYEAVFVCGGVMSCGYDWTQVESAADVEKLRADERYKECIARARETAFIANGKGL